MNVLEQEKVDQLMLDMDGTENKCKLCLQLRSLIDIIQIDSLDVKSVQRLQIP